MKTGKLNDINEMCNILENFQTCLNGRETSKDQSINHLIDHSLTYLINESTSMAKAKSHYQK
jgi:hypothetical protein